MILKRIFLLPLLLATAIFPSTDIEDETSEDITLETIADYDWQYVNEEVEDGFSSAYIYFMTQDDWNYEGFATFYETTTSYLYYFTFDDNDNFEYADTLLKSEIASKNDVLNKLVSVINSKCESATLESGEEWTNLSAEQIRIDNNTLLYYEEIEPLTMTRSIFDNLGSIVSSFGTFIVSLFSSVITLFYANNEITILTKLILMGLGTGLVIWGMYYIRSLIRIKRKGK